MSKGGITFTVDSSPIPMIEVKENGDFYIKGRKTVNDFELYAAMFRFFVESGHIQDRSYLEIYDMVEL